MALLLAGSIGLVEAREAWYRAGPPDAALLYVRSGGVLKKLGLSHDALLADVYWIRAVQHYGGTRLSSDPHKRYDLLYPLLDITTTLDPRFSIAYRFGAVFLAEQYPDGPGRSDQAIALLKKGVAADPKRWQYAQDIGFVYYWWVHDYRAAAEWFQRASEMPGAPWWMKSLAGTTLVQGGDRAASRYLWQGLLETAEHEWLRRTAATRLAQLDALDQIDELTRIVARYQQLVGQVPDSWAKLVRAGWLRAVPVDPTGTPYLLDPSRHAVTVSEGSALFPLPTDMPGTSQLRPR